MAKKTKLYVVLDIGKTISKLSLWDELGQQIENANHINQIKNNEYYQKLDTDGIKDWLLKTLSDFAKKGNIEAIIPVAHGAACAVLKNDELLFDPIDYEWQIPHEIKIQYEKLRDEFSHNLSPNMENGLNLGAQLFYLKTKFKDRFEQATTIIMWAQYWAFLLSDIARYEISSIGAHSDLWSIKNCAPSKMASDLGFANKFASFAKAGDVIGNISAKIAETTGLSPAVKIYAGLHDSNAALLNMRKSAALSAKSFTIISTGTWFVCMRALCESEKFDFENFGKKQGILANIDIEARPIPTALFMGGREIEELNGKNGYRLDLAENQEKLIEILPQVIKNSSLILPCPIEGIGPFAGSELQILNKKDDKIYFAAMIALYIALVINYALNLIESPKNIIIEGRFANSEIITRILASLRTDCEILRPNQDSNISYGALGLILPNLPQTTNFKKVERLNFEITDVESQWLMLLGK